MTKLTTKVVMLSLAAVLLAASLPAAAAERTMLAAEGTKHLPHGVTPCDIFNVRTSKYYNKNFALFNDLLEHLLGYSELKQTTWCGSGGGERYTILAPVNGAVASGLGHLHSKYGTGKDASKFKSAGYPLVYQNNPVQIAFDAIVENHFIPFPIDFYANHTVKRATKAHPLRLPTHSVYASSYIEVYTEKGIVHGTVPGGLVPGRFTIPNAKTYIGPYQAHDDTKIFIYGINKLLVPHSLRVPLTTGHPQSMAQYLKNKVGKCTVAYEPGTPASSRDAGCKNA